MSASLVLLCVGLLLPLSNGMTESRSTTKENVTDENTFEVLENVQTSFQDSGVLLRHMAQEMARFSEKTTMLMSQLQSQQLQLQSQQSELQSQQSKLQSQESMILQLLLAQKNSTSIRPESSRRNTGNDINRVSDSVYVRWGNRRCPNGTAKVYSGVAGGGRYESPGSAVNALCLPLNPVYTNHRVPNGVTLLVGSEYEIYPEPQHDDDVVCAVCLTARTAVLMVPATNVCPTGWTVEYTGYLMAGNHGHPSGTEFICMDVALEGRFGSREDRNGYLFYFVVGQCGSLPCPPYDNRNVLSCVACAKHYSS